jgi:amino acid adenylation domain-containing protein
VAIWTWGRSGRFLIRAVPSSSVFVNQDQILLDFREGKHSAEEVLTLLRQARSLESPLSENQHGLWLLQELEPLSTAYNVPFCVRLNASLDVQQLKAACELICERHPVLTSAIAVKDGVPVQSFRQDGNGPKQGISFRHRDVSHLDEEQLSDLLGAEATVPFKLSEGALIRFVVFTAAPDRHFLLFVAHHIIFDGASTFIFLSELFQVYEELVRRRPHRLKPLRAGYGDFVAWEKRFLSGPEGDVARRYWLGQLSGPLPKLMLPIERADPRALAEGKSYSQRLDDSLTAQLNEFCRSSGSQRGISRSVLFLGVYQLLLHKYVGESDIIVGMPVRGRPKSEFEGLLGYFVNMIAIRSCIDGQQLTRDFFVDLDGRLSDGLDHSAYPFARLVGDLGISSAEDPVFQVAYAFQSGNLARSAAADKTGSLLDKVEIVEDIQQRGEYKLSLEILERQDGFTVNLKYDANRFSDQQIAALSGHYFNLLESVLRYPQRKLSQHSVLSAAEYRQLVYEWNDTATAYPREKCLHELFVEQVERTPDAIAAIYDDQRLTYAELNRRANQLAHYLIKRGVGSDVVVGIAVERSLEMLVGLLGILKAGGAYAPLDPHYPTERLSYMLADCGTPVLLTQQALVERLPAFAGEVICLDSGWEQIAQESDRAPNVEVAAQDLAYVIYTSGSTGEPKGVMNQHDGIVNRLLWMQAQYGLEACDVVLQKTSFSFDVSVWEFFWPLLSGARVVFARPEGHKDDQYLIELIKRHQVSTMHFVPSMLSVMLAAPGFATCTSLKRVFCSGEALGVEQVRQFSECLPATQLHNLYGPTEAAVDVSYWPCVYHAGLRTVPIGKPVANTQLYVLDEDLRPVPVGVSGELHIGGVQLARGYLNKEELTARSFIANPIPGTPGRRLYKTGDVARYLPDGNIEYLGRRDHQVKIRGFRIELGEIESRLLSHPEVQACVVLAREDVAGDKRLVAYVVPAGVDNQIPQPEVQNELRAYLQSHLPSYMVPGVLVALSHLPITANGKLDRKALPSPYAGACRDRVHAEPVSTTEHGVAAIWRDLLAVSRVGRQDNFFELGGHSLLATRALAAMNKEFAVDVSLIEFMQSASLRELASVVDGHLEKSKDDAGEILRKISLIETLSIEELEDILKN